MAKETVYNNTLVSGAADETLTYTRYVKDDSSGKSTKELLDEKVNKTDQLGTTQIADKAVTTEKLENESVTTDKLDAASVTTDKVADANITTSKLADSSVETEKINNKAVTTDKLNDGAVDNSKLSPNAVTSEKIKNESIITEKLNDRAVTTEKVEEKAITNEKIGDSAVDGRTISEASVEKKHLANDSVATEKLQDSAITSDKIHTDAVTEEKIKDSSVSNSKLADNSVGTSKIKDGNITNEKVANNTLTQDKLDPEFRKAIQAATGLPENLVEVIQDVDKEVKTLHSKDTDLQSQITDKQQQITAHDKDIELLQTRSTQMEQTINNIAATGGASVANTVAYTNTTSGLESVNAQGAIDELAAKNKLQDVTISAKAEKSDVQAAVSELKERDSALSAEIVKKANDSDVTLKFTKESERVNGELAKKFNSENITQESGNAEDKVMSQKAVRNELSDLSNKFINFLVSKNPKNITDITENFIDNTVIQRGKVTTKEGFTVFHTLKVDNISGTETRFLYANFEFYGTDVYGNFQNILIVDSQNNIRKADTLLGKNCIAIPVGFTGYFTFKKSNSDIHFVESFYDDSKQELINTILYANSIVQTVETYPVQDVKLEFLNEGKILKKNGELGDNLNYKTTDYITTQNNSSLDIITTTFDGFASGLSNVCYYTDDEHHNLLASFNIKSSKSGVNFAVIRGCSVRFSIKKEETAILKTTYASISKEKYLDAFLSKNIIVSNDLYRADKLIAPSEVIESSFITDKGQAGKLDDVKYKIYKYNVSTLPDIIMIKGTGGVSIDTTLYMFSDIDNVWNGLDNRYTQKGIGKFEHIVKVPKKASYLYLENIVSTQAGLDKPQVYSVKSKVDAGYGIMSTESTIQKAYITNLGKINNIEDSRFSVDIYNVSAYAGGKVILDGKVGFATSTVQYAFSDTNNSIYQSQNLKVLTGGEKKQFSMEEVYVPQEAKYLFISRYTANGDFKVYGVPSKSTQEVISENCLKIQKIEENNTFKIYDSDVLICPIYGQSLAVGGEAYPHITKEIKYKGLQVDENLDDVPINTNSKVELAYYGLQEGLISSFCNTHNLNYKQLVTKICSFCYGLGATSILKFIKGEELYASFLAKIKLAYDNAKEKGNNTVKVPAVVYIQGEADLVPHTQQYKELLAQLQVDLNTDIKAITNQVEDIPIVLYQTNQLNIGKTNDEFDAFRTKVPTSQMQLIRDNDMFIAATPFYWMDFYNENIHITGYWQKVAGYFYGNAILNYIDGRFSNGVVPSGISVSENDIVIKYNTPSLPLVVDTETVTKVGDNFGYNVIKSDKTDILVSVEVYREQVVLHCSESPIGCRVRYGINGSINKAGWKEGPRGNIRDSSIIPIDVDGQNFIAHNWAYMFDELINETEL